MMRFSRILQLPAAKRLHDGQDFLEQVAYSIRNIHKMKERPRELSDPYFKSLFEAADKSFMSEANPKIYDNMIRDEIQIKAKKDYAVKEAVAKALEIGEARGEARGKAEGVAKAVIMMSEIARPGLSRRYLPIMQPTT